MFNVIWLLASTAACLVSDYGAVCDGVTDDSVAIQAANDAACESVVYPQGATCLAHGITVRVDQVGQGATLKIPDDADDWLFNVDAEKITISGFDFDGNRDNQPEPPFTENYDGFAKNSLIQAQNLVEVLIVEDNVFHDTQYGALGLEPAGSSPRQIKKVIVRRNKFERIGRALAWVNNPYDFATIVDDEVHLNGMLVFNDNHATEIGTITTPQPPTNHTNWGEGIIAGGFQTVRIKRNVFIDGVRYDYKFGANNDYLITDNVSINSSWGMLQVQTLEVDPVAIELPGKLVVRGNTFASKNGSGYFAQFKGSLTVDSNSVVHHEVLVENNIISYEPGHPELGDAIQFTQEGRYRNIEVLGNSFHDTYRGAVTVVTPLGFTTESLVIDGNFMRGSQVTSYNSLLYVQGSGEPITDVQVTGNTLVATRVGISSTADAAVNLTVLDNLFLEQDKWYVLAFQNVASMESAEVRGNIIDGAACGLPANTVWVDNEVTVEDDCN